MTMSSEPLFSYSAVYSKLCHKTSKGTYVNAVKKESLDRVTKRFLSTMDVYPSVKRDGIREFFGTI